LRARGPAAFAPHTDETRGNARLRSWRSQPPLDDKELFARRLGTLDLSEHEFCALLGVPAEAFASCASAPPSWLKTMEDAFSRKVVVETGSLFPTDAVTVASPFSFLPALAPLIDHARDRLRAALEAVVRDRPGVSISPDATDGLLTSLASRLTWMAGRTLVLELRVARIQGRLSGDTPEARFASFLHGLGKPGQMPMLLRGYPVLAQQLIQYTEQWISSCLEFFARLCLDIELIKTSLNRGEDPGRLTTLEDAGDNHRHGRKVIIAGFSSGLRVVYKPRSLEADARFQALLCWLNDHGFEPAFRPLTILARDDYGWSEAAGTEDCGSPAEISRFYNRLGGYLALLYILEATDFHLENLIAMGEHPILVDLEALFHPRLGEGKQDPDEDLVGAAFGNSVLRVGLLPQRRWESLDSAGIDVSGLGAVAGQLTPFGVPQWESAGTDEMRLVREHLPLRGLQNRPVLGGAVVNPFDQVAAIEEGFGAVYTLMRENAAELLSDAGPLVRFEDAEMRVIMRPTHTYGLLLQESFHPDVLRDAVDRDALFDRLWIQTPRHPHLARVIPAEIADLHRGDIPVFTTRPDTSDAWTSTGERLTSFFDRPGMEVVRERVGHLRQDDLDKQLWFARASLATLARNNDARRSPYTLGAKPPDAAVRERALALARVIGDRLETLSLRGREGAAWIGLTLRAKDEWSLIGLGVELYDGLPGVALFLAYLGAVTRRERYTELAQAAISTLRRELEQSPALVGGIGAFDGWGGVVYALTHLGALWDEPELLSYAQSLLDGITERIELDERMDIIGGSAGCIATLLGLHRHSGSEKALAAAVRCGDHLLRRAQPMQDGVGWPNRQMSDKPLAGFSHGAAGIAWSLSRLGAATGNTRFDEAAAAAVAYERGLFVPSLGNWEDLRDLGPPTPGPSGGRVAQTTAWCHGAPGIGLGRLGMLRHSDTRTSRIEIATALETTLAQGFGGNHCLCHGDLGNLELIVQAGKVLRYRRWSDLAQELAAAIVERIETHGWQCGNPLKVESPGLMTGLAGIGHGLLKLAAPGRVPSVLTLEPPPETWTADRAAPSVPRK
jgi:type 2 lantibiotic biosynthesis protein LanM